MTQGTVNASRARLVDDDRQPSRFLNYLGAGVRPHPFTPMGPNLLGEYLWPVTVEPSVTGGTRVGLSYIAPERAS